jgi:hypothetical protein
VSDAELILGRYRVESNRSHEYAQLGRDVITGRRVAIVRRDFLEEAKLRATAERLRLRDEPRFFPILSTGPVVLACPEAWDDYRFQPDLDQLRLSVAEAVDATIELIELEAIARVEGVWINVRHAWLERDASGHVRVRLVAPVNWFYSSPNELLHLLAGLIGHRYAVTGIRTPRVTIDEPPQALVGLLREWDDLRQYPKDQTLAPDIPALLSLLLPFAGNRERAAETIALVTRLPSQRRAEDFDLDLAIRLGEEALADRPPPSTHWYDPERGRRFVLASLLHRRACFAIARGDASLALTDVEKAIELDAHPEYLTTLALLRERRGDVAAAESTHDRACAAAVHLAPWPERAEDGSESKPPLRDYDLRASWPKKVARTLHARGVFRARSGDVAAAREDLAASIAAFPTEGAQRALTRLPDC